MFRLFQFLFVISLLCVPSSCALYSHRPPSGFLKWPVVPSSARLTQKFKLNTDRHLGIDLGAPLNTPILASHSGTVVYSGAGFSGFGKMILLENENGWASIYAHLNKSLVKTGQRVVQGQLIGKMGNTGRSSGVHLHFEVRYHKRPVDPLEVLESARQPRLASQ